MQLVLFKIPLFGFSKLSPGYPGRDLFIATLWGGGIQSLNTGPDNVE